ncbi:MAG: aldehyde dehydrogenase family protein [Elusimicrobiales bacterium]|nr:aldehyde dehydrogenase family protein [Elusimicrobiales bacterium]
MKGAAVARARAASARLRMAGPGARAELLRRLRLAMVADLDGLAGDIVRITGKPRAEALMSEIYPALELLRYYEKEGGRILSARARPTPFFFSGSRSRVEYRPYGAVLIIGPFNFPFQLTFVPAITALAAGNAAVVKPSELAPGTGALLERLFAAAGADPDLLIVREGGRDEAAALVSEGPDKVFFTGGAAGGRAVMRLCAEKAVPLCLELGGKSPMLVFADAGLERAAQGAAYGAFCNSGQVCVSVERILVQRAVYPDFLAAFKRAALAVRPGGADGDYGPMISEDKARAVMAMAREAADGGGELVTPLRYEDGLLYPVIVAGPPPGCRLMNEEIFGPAAAVLPFDTEEEGIALANAHHSGLAASVWTSDRERAARVAAALDAGSISVNDVIRQVGSPYLPFGGVKSSGFGRYHGPEGLLEFSRAVSVMENFSGTPSEANWFPYGAELYGAMKDSMTALFGTFSPGAWRRALGAARKIKERVNRGKDNDRD